jgi:polyphosphate kinase
VRIDEPNHVDQLRDLMAKGMSGDYSHWTLGPDGRWSRHTADADGAPLPDLQAAMIEAHAKRRRKARRR